MDVLGAAILGIDEDVDLLELVDEHDEGLLERLRDGRGEDGRGVGGTCHEGEVVDGADEGLDLSAIEARDDDDGDPRPRERLGQLAVMSGEETLTFAVSFSPSFASCLGHVPLRCHSDVCRDECSSLHWIS